ncbi:lysylphosphatidylglycerol synthase transmembrane domain-containing protein [Salinifilum aidingensis]
MRRARRAAVRVLVTGGVLALLTWQVGPGAFARGVQVVDVATAGAALALGAASTACNAARWCRVARGLGIRLPLGRAIADYYRAQFLNAALPGGVFGDVHRAVQHGLAGPARGRRVRAVVLERVAGQVVLLPLAVAAVALAPALAELRFGVLITALAAAGGLIGAVAVAALLARTGRRAARWRRVLAETLADLRELAAPGACARIIALSVAALAGHLALFVVAARAVGIAAPVEQVLPLAVVALVAMSVPVNIGGWGLREGAAAAAFALAGLGAAQGVAVSVAYGVLALVACLPGAGVLLLQRHRPRSGQVELEQRVGAEGEPAHGGAQRIAHARRPRKAQAGHTVAQ